MQFAISGVWSAVATPLDEALNPEGAKLDRQCRWLLDNNYGAAEAWQVLRNRSVQRPL